MYRNYNDFYLRTFSMIEVFCPSIIGPDKTGRPQGNLCLRVIWVINENLVWNLEYFFLNCFSCFFPDTVH